MHQPRGGFGVKQRLCGEEEEEDEAAKGGIYRREEREDASS
jgi:hypothetical protein